jgi:acyl-CoA thioesterase-1
VSPSRTVNYAAELQTRLNATGLRWTVQNNSIPGDTTAGGLRRLDQAIASDPEILLLELGANDGLRGVDAGVVERNLSIMIERAQAHGIRVLLCGMETPPTHGWDYTVAFHRLFPRLAAKYGIALVPFLLAGVALNPELNGDDLIHPNATGAQRIAETIWPFLEPMVRESAAVGSP